MPLCEVDLSTTFEYRLEGKPRVRINYEVDPGVNSNPGKIAGVHPEASNFVWAIPDVVCEPKVSFLCWTRLSVEGRTGTQHIPLDAF